MGLHWLEFEEIIGRRWHRWASDAASYPRYPAAAVALASVQATAGTCFRALGGAPGLGLDAVPARSSRHRLTWRQRLGLDDEQLTLARRDEENVLLPPAIDWFPDPALNRDAYLWLAAFLARARHRDLPSDPLQRDLALLRETARVSRSACARLPGLARRYRRLCAALLAVRPQRSLPPAERDLEAVIRALLGAPEALAPGARAMHDAVHSPVAPLARWRAPRGYRPPLPVPLWGEVLSRPPAPPRGSDTESPREDGNDTGHGGPKRRAERRRLDQTERDDPLLLNRFEKMLAWADMVNVNRPVDDDDRDAARRAADQLEQLTVSGHRREASTRLRMDLDLGAQAADGPALRATLTYPEWHYRRQRYLPDHCRVIAEPAAEEGEDWIPDAATRRRIRRVRQQFEALQPRRELLRAQMDGADLDTDAVVRAHCDLAAGGAGSDRIYLDHRDQSRDLAVAILVDVSLSTEAWVEDRRVIDVEKEALLSLIHGLAACGDDFAVYTFTSQRREQVWVRTVKRFDERLGPVVERRVQALKPGHYTRMGPAIRHVNAELLRQPSRHRLLLMLTDGKPNDTDHYEGRYGIEDSRRAVQEARRSGAVVFGVTIDQEAQHYLPRLFGRGAFEIVRRPAALPAALPAIYRQLILQ
ncbi:Nitric oxide reductase activation protein NorD [Thioalkalivibrio nitratireducens DSM 14787]|uniref:Nitric oxide reductase activation protein NorD n=1 Tax=Thioalkalivibrio nitratireducens (strain DSM 14787 / UNIQEM 213 / ALEN2) TaxID=1255043 RepID=L0DWC7_THIND|nr:VWA domain-containing protein [Thioalkalivibrio nitratireducens]AGA33322.1 Nitric oxide reductase activation protein NorD [Thioalkalivibrio nitratireducens DSM 14787]